MIRPYTHQDRNPVIALLQMNIPQYFAPSEESDFIEYLDQELEDYFVVEDQGQIIGCGGVNYLPEAAQARISWDMIHPDFQGRGIGKKLTLHRIDHIQKKPEIREIVVRTSQLAFPFYQKLGFEIEKTEKDFWAEGFDLYQMKIILDHAEI